MRREKEKGRAKSKQVRRIKQEQDAYLKTEKMVVFSQVAKAVIEDLLREYSIEEIHRMWGYVKNEKV